VEIVKIEKITSNLFRHIEQNCMIHNAVADIVVSTNMAAKTDYCGMVSSLDNPCPCTHTFLTMVIL